MGHRLQNTRPLSTLSNDHIMQKPELRVAEVEVFCTELKKISKKPLQQLKDDKCSKNSVDDTPF